MNQGEWLACADPRPMLNFLRGGLGNRKLRLFACACCRDVWHLIDDQRSRCAVELAERFADDVATAKELADAWSAAWDAARVDIRDGTRSVSANASRERARDASRDSACAAAWDAACKTSHTAASTVAWATWSPSWQAALVTALRVQAALLRDIVGNPFRPATFDLALFTPPLSSLAWAAYETRSDEGTLDPVRLAVLADCLEEAGADDCLTTALRSPGPHYRGLWALDLVLGWGRGMSDDRR